MVDADGEGMSVRMADGWGRFWYYEDMETDKRENVAAVRCSVAGMESCYGCGVCAAVCPKKCITMVLSSEGFWVPHVAGGACVACGLCAKLCPVLSPIPAEDLQHRVLGGGAAWLKDAVLLRKSSSGGAVSAVAQTLAAEGYGFCGVRYVSERLRAEHFLAKTLADFAPAQGSKYLQSLTLPAFRELLAGEGKWLVVGTPCQIAALRRLLRQRHIEEYFVLVDFVCHGVPSDKLWKAFVRQIAKGRDVRRFDVIWRGKTRGWQDSWELRLTEVGQTRYVGYATEDDTWYRHFLRCTAQNLKCFACPFVGTHSGADIRVSDFWGERFRRNTAGVSRVLALTERGRAVWARAAWLCETEPLTEAEVASIEGQVPHTEPPAWGRGVFIRLLAWPWGFRLAHGWSLIGCVWARAKRLFAKGRA